MIRRDQANVTSELSSMNANIAAICSLLARAVGSPIKIVVVRLRVFRIRVRNKSDIALYQMMMMIQIGEDISKRCMEQLLAWENEGLEKKKTKS